MSRPHANVLLIEVPPHLEAALANEDLEARSTSLDAALDYRGRPSVVVLRATTDVDRLRDAVDHFRSVGCATVLMVDSYDPAAIAQLLETGAGALVQERISTTEFARIIRRELGTLGAVSPDTALQVPTMVGGSQSVHDLCELLVRTAPSSLPVLITGESGTGKELVARTVHRLSERRAQSFVAVNCGAIPETLIESALFGHEKGAFTGATSQQAGHFERANGGTLFLDEIGELPLSMQVKLLRVIEDQRVTRLGAASATTVDVRLVCATNRNLPDEVAAGRFRADLMYRIDVLRIETPPLRQRASDIQLLWEHFVRKTAAREGRSALQTHPDVVRMLMQYDWPGNVRELENVARQAVILRSSGKITPRIVRDRLQSDRTPTPAHVPSSGQSQDSELRSLVEIERDAIIRTFQATNSVRESAEILGISERKLYYRLKEYREEGWLIDDQPTKSKRPRLVFAHADKGQWERNLSTFEAQFDTLWVPDGLQLLSAIHTTPPDALIVQANLPVLDGLNVLELGFEQGWEFPVVLVGDAADDGQRDYAEALGAHAFLTADCRPTELKWVLETALTTRVEAPD